MHWRKFESKARRVLEKCWGEKLQVKKVGNVPKKWDFVSEDEQIVGDAKYLTLVQGKRRPPAKFMEIAAHVWLLEKVQAERRFLVFGNQKDVSVDWIKLYGKLVKNVEFYFLYEDEKLCKLL